MCVWFVWSWDIESKIIQREFAGPPMGKFHVSRARLQAPGKPRLCPSQNGINSSILPNSEMFWGWTKSYFMNSGCSRKKEKLALLEHGQPYSHFWKQPVLGAFIKQDSSTSFSKPYEPREKTVKRNCEWYLKICTEIFKNLKCRNTCQEKNHLADKYWFIR